MGRQKLVHLEHGDLALAEHRLEGLVSQDRSGDPHETKRTQPDDGINRDQYRNEIIDISGLVEPEHFYFDAPHLEPDRFVPDHDQPESDLDWEMGG